MEWTLDKNRPICPQIEELICARIAAGEFQQNERLKSVREVAVEAGVNPNTVQKAFCELERDGLIYSKPGSGWYVSEDDRLARERFNGLIREKTASFVNDMEKLGISREEIIQIIQGGIQ